MRAHWIAALLISLALVTSTVLYFRQLSWLLARHVHKAVMAGGAFVQGIPSTDRRKAAVLGALVADAATMPLHWYARQLTDDRTRFAHHHTCMTPMNPRLYVPDDIEYKVDMSASKQPAFHDPPSCPFYEYPLGALSPYGDEVLPLLDSLIGMQRWNNTTSPPLKHRRRHV